MRIRVKRLEGTEKEPFSAEIQGHWPDATMILIHIERLPGIRVLSKASAAMTDDVQIEFTYKGFPFTVESPFSYLWITASSPDVPEAVFEELIEHIKNYKPVWPHQLISGIIRHMKLPRNANPAVHRIAQKSGSR